MLTVYTPLSFIIEKDLCVHTFKGMHTHGAIQAHLLFIKNPKAMGCKVLQSIVAAEITQVAECGRLYCK